MKGGSTNKGEIHSDVSLDVVVDAEGVVVDLVAVVEVMPLLLLLLLLLVPLLLGVVVDVVAEAEVQIQSRLKLHTQILQHVEADRSKQIYLTGSCRCEVPRCGRYSAWRALRNECTFQQQQQQSPSRIELMTRAPGRKIARRDNLFVRAIQCILLFVRRRRLPPV